MALPHVLMHFKTTEMKVLLTLATCFGMSDSFATRPEDIPAGPHFVHDLAQRLARHLAQQRAPLFQRRAAEEGLRVRVSLKAPAIPPLLRRRRGPARRHEQRVTAQV